MPQPRVGRGASGLEGPPTSWWNGLAEKPCAGPALRHPRKDNVNDVVLAPSAGEDVGNSRTDIDEYQVNARLTRCAEGSLPNDAVALRCAARARWGEARLSSAWHGARRGRAARTMFRSLARSRRRASSIPRWRSCRSRPSSPRSYLRGLSKWPNSSSRRGSLGAGLPMPIGRFQQTRSSR